MKTLIVECKFTIEVPWDEAWNDPHFQIEENGCPGTGSVDGALSKLMEAAQKNSICWACTVGGKNKILAIEDREPRDYAAEIEFKEEPAPPQKCYCGAEMAGTLRKNAQITETRYYCPHCKASSLSMSSS